MNKLQIVIVNLNCGFHTKNLIEQLDTQTFKDFTLYYYDQGSREKESIDLYNSLENKKNYVLKNNGWNRPLNRIWNEAAENKFEYTFFLNNDIIIPNNFIEHTIMVFENEPEVSAVCHPTNHPSFTTVKNNLEYVIPANKSRQGWDICIKTQDWVEIPPQLDFYCGDDFIFENIFQRNKRIAFCTSSPIIHLLSQTRKSNNNKIIENRNPVKDVEEYKKLGFKHYLTFDENYSKLDPTFLKLKYENNN